MSELYDVEMSREGMRRLIVESGQQYTPLLALKEYVTNAIDAIDEARDRGIMKQGLVKILFQPANHRIVIQDDALGMSKEILSQLPKRVGESSKSGHVDRRGEKGVGLLSFLSLGYQMHIISRTSKESPYHYLRYEFSGERVRHTPVCDLNDSALRAFGGTFKRGTQIILDVSKDLFNQRFKPDNLQQVRNELREIYWPILEKEHIDFLTGIDRGKPVPEMHALQPLKIHGEEIFRGEIPFTVQKDGKPLPCALYAHLWLDTKNTTSGRVSVYSKGVRVYKSILDLDEPSLSECQLWTCRQVRGFVEEPHLKLTLGRDKINTIGVRESNVYKGLVKELVELDTRLWSNIKSRLSQYETHKHEQFRKELHDALNDAWRTLDPLYKKRRNINPDGIIIWDIPTDDPDGKDGDKPKKPRKPRSEGIPIDIPTFCAFGMDERHLRSKLEMQVGGNPGVLVNEGHANFEAIVKPGSASPAALQYLFRAIIAPVVEWSVQEAMKKGVTFEGGVREQIEVIRQRTDDAVYHALQNFLPKKA